MRLEELNVRSVLRHKQYTGGGDVVMERAVARCSIKPAAQCVFQLGYHSRWRGQNKLN